MAYRHRNCQCCGKQFSYEIGRGKDRKLCGEECITAVRKKKEEGRRAVADLCSVIGCGCKVRSAGAVLCEKHYMRLRRHGDVRRKVDANPPEPVALHSHGYVMEYYPGHPLARGARVYQHRRVFFDAHGDGPFTCKWCGCNVSWDDMHVDHLNAVRDDNRIENLVASCASCNTGCERSMSADAARKRAKHRYELYGETLTAQQWASRIGISRNSLLARLAAGWPIERALTEARGSTGPKTGAA